MAAATGYNAKIHTKWPAMTRLRLYFRKLFLGKSVPTSVQVLLYTRTGCHLCEVAKDQLKTALEGRHYSFQEVDIGTDAELLNRFGKDIPVVVINGKVRFRGIINPVL